MKYTFFLQAKDIEELTKITVTLYDLVIPIKEEYLNLSLDYFRDSPFSVVLNLAAKENLKFRELNEAFCVIDQELEDKNFKYKVKFVPQEGVELTIPGHF